MTSARGSRGLNPNLTHLTLPRWGERSPYRAARHTAFHSLGPLFHLRRTQLRKYTCRAHRVAFRGKAVSRTHMGRKAWDFLSVQLATQLQ